MNVKTNDKIFIRHGDYNIPFIGLEEALKEYNEEIQSVEFKLDTPTLVNDVKSQTKTFMKRS